MPGQGVDGALVGTADFELVRFGVAAVIKQDVATLDAGSELVGVEGVWGQLANAFTEAILGGRAWGSEVKLEDDALRSAGKEAVGVVLNEADGVDGAPFRMERGGQLRRSPEQRRPCRGSASGG